MWCMASFNIEVDRFEAILEATGTGFWTTDTARDYLAAELAAIADLGVPVNEIRILFDASQFAVQNREVIDLLRSPVNPLWRAKRGAFVTPRGLGMMQIRRGTPYPHIGVFETQAEARHFLRAA